MDESKALNIISALANGVHPSTGEVFSADSPYQSPEVVRALFVVIRALEGRLKTQARRTEMPGNAGKPWSTEEDQRLLAGFDSGRELKLLAQDHQRTSAGIQARLEKHGRLQPSTSDYPSAHPEAHRRSQPVQPPANSKTTYSRQRT